MKKTYFVAAGEDGCRLLSANGTDWQRQETGRDGETYRAACFGNGVCIAVGSHGGTNILSVLNQDLVWKTIVHDAKYKNFLRGFGFGKSFFLGLGGDPGAVGVSDPFIMTTIRGETWQGPIKITGKNILRRVAYGNDRFVAVGDRGRRSHSIDGKVWNDVPDTKAIDTLVDVAFGNGIFIGVGLHGLRMKSEDGSKWTDRQLGEEGEHLNSIVWTGHEFVAIGAGATYYSKDGSQWQRKPNSNQPQTAVFGDNKFVGAAWKGRLRVSDDGCVWREIHRITKHIETIAWGELLMG